MSQVAPPAPQRGRHRGQLLATRRSRYVVGGAAGIVILAIIVVLAVVILPGQISGNSGQGPAAAKSSSPAPVTSHPATPTPSPSVTPPLAGSWKLKLDDEFTGPSLDTSAWSTGWFGSGETNPVSDLEDDCYDPSQVVQTGGDLDLNLIKKHTDCDGGNDYSTGAVSTAGKYTFTYGLIESRIWVPASQGDVANWPAFWTDGSHWPEDGEIDIAEGLGGDMCAHLHNSAHPSGIGPGCPSGLFAGGWHTFAADWEPNSLTFYYDGQDIGSVTKGVTSAPMFLVLDYATGTAGGPTLAPATMKVDYVRVWQHS